jgi:hypothetical protein
MHPLKKGAETGMVGKLIWTRKKFLISNDVEIPSTWYLDDLPPMMFIKKGKYQWNITPN